MPTDLASFYLLIGKIVVWIGAAATGLAVLAIIISVISYFTIRIHSTLRARRYVRHWEIIRSYVNRREPNLDDLQYALTDALQEGVKAYDAFPGKDTQKLDAAMTAFAKAIIYLGEGDYKGLLFLPEKTAQVPSSLQQASPEKS